MTSYNYSYNVLINRLEAFAAGHFLIKRFTHGQIDLADQLQDDQYPFMHVTPDTITPIQGGMQFGFLILFADIPRDKEYKAEYQREVISDCIRLGQDLIAEVRNGLELFGFDVQLVNIPTFEPFIEEYKNTVTGVGFTLTLEVPWDWSACDIPAVWAVGGSSSGGSGTGYGLTLRTNGVDNAVQNILDLVEGTNVTITDNGDGSVTIDAAGGGGGGGELVSTEFNVNHTTATGNPYVIGDRVWYNGNVYRCIATNDALLPTNTLYWTLVGVGYRLRQTPVDWNATSGDYQILNKPTIPAAQVNSDWDAVSGIAEILNKPTIPAAQVNSDWNASSGVAEILNKPTIPAAQVNSDWDAVSGVAEILNKPTIPAAQVNSDWDAISGVEEILNKPTLATVATTGDYADLINQPTIPTNLDDLADVNVAGVTNGQVLTYNTLFGNWLAVTPASGGSVTSVATAGLISGGPITTSGTITTAMTTNKLVGRATAGSGIMEEITIGSGLTLTGAGVLNNTATPTPTGYYGAFKDNTTQTAVSANTAYPVKFNTTNLSNGVTVVNDGSSNPTRVTLANTGIYNIQFSLQMEKTGGSGNMVADIWIRKNGVDIPSTTGKIVLTGSANASPVVAAWNYVLDLVAEDYVQLMWSTSNTNVEIVAAGPTAPHPAIPSSILTITQQAGILAGTGITAINSLTGAVQTLTTGTAGTDFGISSAGSTHTFNLPTADATNRGALSSADWSTFNGKQNAIAFTDVGTALATTIADPNAINYIRINANNSVSAITASQLKFELLAGTPYGVVAYGTAFVATVTGSSTLYGAITAGQLAFNATISNREFTIPFGGRVKNLYLHTSNQQGSGGSLVVTVMQNLTATSLSITVPASGLAQTRSNLTDSFTAVAGDKLVFRFVNNHTNVSAVIVSVSFIIEQL
jgi:hypothetical protein